MRRSSCILLAFFVVAGISVLTGWSFQAVISTSSVERPLINPVPIPAGKPVEVAVSSRVHTAPNDASVSDAEVYLLRYDSANRLIANLGFMHDDGVDGDAVAGDQVFSIRFNLNEPPGELRVAVSALMAGMTRGLLSEVASAPILATRLPVSIA